MSTQVLRFHPFTVSFLSTRRGRRAHNLVSSIRLATSTRRVKQLLRHLSPMR